jgi:hypothetical protein
VRFLQKDITSTFHKLGIVAHEYEAGMRVIRNAMQVVFGKGTKFYCELLPAFLPSGKTLIKDKREQILSVAGGSDFDEFLQGEMGCLGAPTFPNAEAGVWIKEQVVLAFSGRGEILPPVVWYRIKLL